ncbi:hypothetical protein BN873_240016 [Candidatus Competibacter denitrificans Run_A_D11]|uniref:Uncharacterized protein n=1 Tax=Candidatus Competibacter denitrificans Run_A_D11 TaxID=1400863 RepID=W6MCM5_9GAMM|nr:hypothetical protein BN873_240016 [Candidatus Competibacter denitrificans Run_A_D11]
MVVVITAGHDHIQGGVWAVREGYSDHPASVRLAERGSYPRMVCGRRALSSKWCETSRRMWVVVCYIHTVPLVRPV